MISRNKINYTIATLCLIVISCIIDNDTLRRFLWLLFGVQLYFATRVAKDFKNKVIYFFSPSFLAVLYVNLNAVIGGYALYYRHIISVYQYRVNEFYKLNNLSISVSFFLLCSWVAITIYRSPKIEIEKKNISTTLVQQWKLISLSLVLILLLSVVTIDLSILGGNGDFSTIPKTVIAIILFYELAKMQTKYRGLVYILVFCIFVFTNYESKRETFFLIIPMLFIECFYGNIRIYFNLKEILITSVVIAGLIFSMLIMTIARGFGAYKMDTPIDAIKYVPNLIKDYDITALLYTTSEAPTTTYHSLKAIAFIDREPELVSYGATYAKIFFVPFPKDLIGFKPLSMTSRFTKREAPQFYQMGGSLPINIYAEAYWNFHYLGVLFFVIMFGSLNYAYYNLCLMLSEHKRHFILATLLFSYTYLLGFYRGFGFDLYFVNCAVAFLSAFFIQKILYYSFLDQ